MSVQPTATAEVVAPSKGAWSAVGALTLCVSTLIASEFMPVSLLTPLAAELRMTAGMAGQAIAVSGIFAVLTSLSIGSLTRRIDRKVVLLGMTGLMILSGLMVALAPNTSLFMAGRALIGVVIGGFWSMSTATVMRLVPEDQLSRALGLLNGGNALAATIAAPLGSFLGQYIGWRGAFFVVVPLGALTLAWQQLSLPALTPETSDHHGSVFRVLRRPRVPVGMAALGALFAGQFALFTYLRPFLETVARADVSTLSLMLLGLGSAGLVGTYLVGFLLRKWLWGLAIGMPLTMAAIAVGLISLGASPVVTAALLAGWGLIGTAAPVVWSTWLTRVLPDDAEAGGGLMVAVIQLAITLGAGLGGLLVDASGYTAAFAASAGLLSASSVLAWLASRPARAARPIIVFGWRLG